MNISHHQMITISISEADEQFKSLVDLALHGEQVFIEVDSRLLVLQEYPAIEPIPPGALDGVYSEEEIRQDNLFAKRSVIPLDP